jgi:hypothetical protein
MLWHGYCDQLAVPGWHDSVYLILFFGSVVKVPIHDSDDGTNRPQAIADIWEDFPMLHKHQHGTCEPNNVPIRLNNLK